MLLVMKLSVIAKLKLATIESTINRTAVLVLLVHPIGQRKLLYFNLDKEKCLEVEVYCHALFLWIFNGRRESETHI